MSDANDILVDNIRESYQRIEQFALVSLATSLWLLAIFQVNPTLSEGNPVPKLDLPLGFALDAPIFQLGLIATLAYFVSGGFMAIHYLGARRALKQLQRQAPELFEALKTYPSIMTLPGILPLMTFLVLGGLGMLAIILQSSRPENFWKGLWVAVIIASPYIILSGLAFGNRLSEMSKETKTNKPLGSNHA